METANKHTFLKVIAYFILIASIATNATLVIMNIDEVNFIFGKNILNLIFLALSIFVHCEHYRLKHRRFYSAVQIPSKNVVYLRKINDFDKEFLNSEEYDLLFKYFQIIHLSGMLFYIYVLFVSKSPYVGIIPSIATDLVADTISDITIRLARKNEVPVLEEVDRIKEEKFKEDQEEQKKREELGDWQFKV